MPPDVARAKDHAALTRALESQPDLLEEFVTKPAEVLQRLGLKEDALRCTTEAHAAIARAEKVVERTKGIGSRSLTDELVKLTQIAREGLGVDATIGIVPFGIRFAERVKGSRDLDLTGTGTVECTFGGLECHADGDG